MLKLSSSLSFFYKYIFPCLWITGASAFWLYSYFQDIVAFVYLLGFMIAYVILISLVVLSRISTNVYVDFEGGIVYAYDKKGGKQKVGHINDLHRVTKIFFTYIALTFSTGVTIRYIPKSYFTFEGPDNTERILRGIARSNRKSKLCFED